MSEPGQRRALSHVGGQAYAEGDPAIAEHLKRALMVPPGEDAHREHVHGFHSYPARLHPAVARGLIDGLAPVGGAVLDPFCGSGTVLVEARLSGRRAIGTDLNPIAIRLASLKATGRVLAQREALSLAAARVAAVATERRTKRVGASRRYPAADVGSFAPHVLLELDGLRVGITAESDAAIRADLELVLSSLLTKLSRHRGDSAEGTTEKRIAAGYPARLFVNKTKELVLRLSELEALLPADAPAARVAEDDARRLATVAAGACDLVVTSPPYPGNYDYLAHHALRLRWLGLPPERLEQGEIGARRHLEARSADDSRAAWLAQLTEVLGAMRRVLRRGGGAVLVLADSVVSGQPYLNDELTKIAGRAAGMQIVARAWQERPHFHAPTQNAFRRRPRCEHAIFLAPYAERPAPKR